MNPRAWSSSIAPVYAALGCTSAEWEETYNNILLDTDVLVEDVILNTIGPNGQYHRELVATEQKYRLDKLLEGMMKYAPTSAGKRYVAIAVHIAHGKGPEAVVKVAQVWMQSLFLRMTAFATLGTQEISSSSQTPTHDGTGAKIEPSARSEQRILREKLCCLRWPPSTADTGNSSDNVKTTVVRSHTYSITHDFTN
ncbi:hypothetical protein DAEQUDRAFT_762782 [Daedalea quercina L-15889]|uniref:Uncharacterized protein n=1 Tax=Daedalea quercina L-15889 TaxID=1314783 RepID=A0A165STZ4_9APHY|nr:hypothetical protein DAEQUDRAFT_762782 [Daedalea quercina L-15889]